VAYSDIFGDHNFYVNMEPVWRRDISPGP
jgi:hypothetical protein